MQNVVVVGEPWWRHTIGAKPQSRRQNGLPLDPSSARGLDLFLCPGAGLYVAASHIVALSAGAAGGRRPRPLILAAVLLAVSGITLAGVAVSVPLWTITLLIAAVGIGLGNTGSRGALVEAVPVGRIVTAMVVWSPVGIMGYLLGPLAGGAVADAAGYQYVGLVPTAAALVVMVLIRRAPEPT